MTRYSGSLAFLVGGFVLLIGVLAIEPWTWATAVGLAAGVVLLALGLWLGVPRMREFARQESPSSRRRPTGIALAWSSAVIAVAASIAVAYGARKLGNALDIHLDLGVVGALIGAAATMYAGLLQYVSEQQTQMPEDRA